jgi:hypothetical protein
VIDRYGISTTVVSSCLATRLSRHISGITQTLSFFMKHMLRIILFYLICLVGTAVSQVKPAEIVKLDSQLLFLPSSNFGDSSLSLSRQYVGVSSGYPISSDFILTTGLSQEASQYDWDNEQLLSPLFKESEPIGDTYLHRFSLGGVYKDGDSTTIFKNFLNSSGDYQGGNPLTYGLLAIHSYSMSKDLSLAFVFIFNTQLEGSPSAIPAVGFKWNINDTSTLELTGEILGPVLRYTSEINDTFSLFIQGKRESREFRIDTAAVQNGVYYDRSNPIITGVMWKKAATSISLGAGVDVARQLRIEDEKGDKLVAKSGEITPVISLLLRTGF